MASRELNLTFTDDEMEDPPVAIDKLATNVLAWASERQSEGKALELNLFIDLSEGFGDVADDLVGSAFFDNGAVFSMFQGKVVSVAVRNPGGGLASRGFTFVVDDNMEEE